MSECFIGCFRGDSFVDLDHCFLHRFHMSFPFERVTGLFQIFDTFFVRLPRKFFGDHRCSHFHRCLDTLIPMRVVDMWQMQTSKLPWQQCEKKEHVADAIVQTTTAAMRKERKCGRRKRTNYHSGNAKRKKMWQTQTSKLSQRQCEKKEYVADANFQATTASNLLEFSKCVRVGGPNVMADSNPNKWFKLMPVLGPSCSPLIKQDSSFWKDCIFHWCEIAPLGSYFLTVRFFIYKSSSNWTVLVILVPTWLKSVFSARLWRNERFYLKLRINRLLALFQIQLAKR